MVSAQCEAPRSGKSSRSTDVITICFNLSSLIESKYPGLSRGVYKKEGPGVNGIYNQDISSNVMLIELGGVDNTISEVVNTVNALTDVLSTYISNEKN